jgi:hypothetical protein
MTWSQFKALVREFLPVDAEREGAQTFIDRLIEAALTSIQELVPYYREGLEAIYQQSDLVVEGLASRGTLPDRARPREAYIASLDADGNETGRTDLASVSFADRYSLIRGGRENGAIAIAGWGGIFYVSPYVQADRRLVIVWDGIKSTFADGDGLPKFGLREAEAIALYVKSELARRSDNDLQSWQTYERDWLTKRQGLYLGAKEMTEVTR